MLFYLHADDGSNYLQSIYIDFIHFRSQKNRQQFLKWW